MNKTFVDEKYQKQFEEKGYVLVPVLGAEQIDVLSDVINKHAAQLEGAFHSTHFSSDAEYKKQAHTFIEETVFPCVAPLLTGHIPIFGNFMVKNPDPHVYMQLHADWAYVEEPSMRSIAVWIPLVDTDEHNGCLGVIEGSHKILNAIRGPGIKQSSYLHDKEWVEKYGKLLPMKAGEAIIYDHALLHYSPANKSGKVRPALNLSVVPDAVPLIHYYSASDTDVIEKYELDSADFFIGYESFKSPKGGKKIAEISRQGFETIDAKMVEVYGFGDSVWQRLGKNVKRIFGTQKSYQHE